MSWLETIFIKQRRQDQRGLQFLRASIILLGLVICLDFVRSLPASPARADGGEPQPTQTIPAGQPTSALLAPSLLDTSSTPTATVEVKSFEIIIDSNQNATVQPVAPEGQAAISNLRDPNAQAALATREEEFISPLWVFGFFTLVIFILVINSVAKGLRSRA